MGAAALSAWLGESGVDQIVKLRDPPGLRYRGLGCRFRESVAHYALGISTAPHEIFSWLPTALYSSGIVRKPSADR